MSASELVRLKRPLVFWPPEQTWAGIEIAAGTVVTINRNRIRSRLELMRNGIPYDRHIRSDDVDYDVRPLSALEALAYA